MKALAKILSSAILGVSLVVPTIAYAADASENAQESPIFMFSFSNEDTMSDTDPAQIDMVAEVATPAEIAQATNTDAVIVDEADGWQMTGLENQLAFISETISAKADTVEAILVDDASTSGASDTNAYVAMSAPTTSTRNIGSNTTTASTTVMGFIYYPEPESN